MSRRKITTEVEVELDPTLLAESFAALDSIEQALFFKEVYRAMGEYTRTDYALNDGQPMGAYGRDMQMLAIVDELKKDEHGPAMSFFDEMDCFINPMDEDEDDEFEIEGVMVLQHRPAFDECRFPIYYGRKCEPVITELEKCLYISPDMTTYRPKPGDSLEIDGNRTLFLPNGETIEGPPGDEMEPGRYEIIAGSAGMFGTNMTIKICGEDPGPETLDDIYPVDKPKPKRTEGDDLMDFFSGKR